MKKIFIVLLITGAFYGCLWLAMDLPRDYSGLTAISGSPEINWYSPILLKNSLQFSCYVIYFIALIYIIKHKNKARFYEPNSYEWVQAFKAKKP